MRAEYDTAADALGIYLLDDEQADHDDELDGSYCTVAVAGDGRAVAVELLSPRDHLGLLARAADAYDLERGALEAAAGSALAAPDRPVRVELLPSS